MFIFHGVRWFIVLLILCIAAGCSKKTIHQTPEALMSAYYEAVTKADLRHVLIDEETGETGVEGDASDIFELYDFGDLSPEDHAPAKKHAIWTAFNDKRAFIRSDEHGVEKVEILGVDRTGQDEEGHYSRVKLRLILKNGQTKEAFRLTYQRGKEYKLLYPKSVFSRVSN